MKISRFLPPLVLLALAGCSSQADSPAPRPDPTVGLTNQQKIEKIQSDPNIPEGLKRIQTETLQHQPGATP